jgi:bacterial/archaeal transporter family-2 protein
MLGAALSILLAVSAGLAIVIQQALNANLRTALNSAVWSGFTSYFVGLLCMAALALALRESIPSVGAVARVPWWTWSGGMFGAIFIALAILLIPKLGAATFIALLITGQMLASVAFDHFGWLGLAHRPIALPRLLGVALLIGGVVLIRR